jgi:hypothetical protein
MGEAVVSDYSALESEAPSDAASDLRVATGKIVVAYPCVPIDLAATFAHPGSAGGHSAAWTPGDGSAPGAAVVAETVAAEGASGTARLTHRFAQPGGYDAVCTVRDGSGAVSRDSLLVQCVELLNPGFEKGFRDWPVGQVANYWQPYVSASASGKPVATVASNVTAVPPSYSAEEFIVHGGQRAQRIGSERAFHAGLFQLLAANGGWDYQVTAWYQLAGLTGGFARLGVDPGGGLDPSGANVVWSLGLLHLDWFQLAVRVTATGPLVTVFLDAGADRQGGKAVFDDVEVVPYPNRQRALLHPEASEYLSEISA